MPIKPRRFIQLRENSTRWSQEFELTQNFLEECCDCGLTHRWRTRIVNGRVMARLQVAPHYTAQARKRRRRP